MDTILISAAIVICGFACFALGFWAGVAFGKESLRKELFQQFSKMLDEELDEDEKKEEPFRFSDREDL